MGFASFSKLRVSQGVPCSLVKLPCVPMPLHFFFLLFCSLATFLYHQNQHLVVPMFPKTGPCSLIPYNTFPLSLHSPTAPWEILQPLFLWHRELRNVGLYCNNSSSSLYHLHRSIILFFFPFLFVLFLNLFLLNYLVLFFLCLPRLAKLCESRGS